MSRFILRKAQLINRGSSMAKPSGENTQNNMTEYSSDNNKKTILVTVVAGVIVLVALIWWANQAKAPQEAGVSPTPTPDAEAAAINQDVENINVGDLNSEFEAIDKDLQGL